MTRSPRAGGSDIRIGVFFVEDGTVGANATHAYWNSNASSVRRVAHGSGTEADIELGIPAERFAVDDNHLVIAEGDRTSSFELVGLAERPLVTGRPTHAVALDGEHAYGASCGDVTGELWRVAFDTGRVEQLANECAASFAIDDHFVYTAEAVDGNDSAIVRYGKTNGGREVLASVTGAEEIAVRDGYVYARLANLGIVRVPADGGAPDAIATTAFPITGFAIDEATLYWTDAGNDSFTLNRTPLP